jgi:hypothetical protein
MQGPVQFPGSLRIRVSLTDWTTPARPALSVLRTGIRHGGSWVRSAEGPRSHSRCRWREWASIKAPEERGGKTRVRQTYCGLSCRAGERAGLFRCGTSRGLRCLFHMSGAQ